MHSYRCSVLYIIVSTHFRSFPNQIILMIIWAFAVICHCIWPFYSIKIISKEPLRTLKITLQYFKSIQTNLSNFTPVVQSMCILNTFLSVHILSFAQPSSRKFKKSFLNLGSFYSHQMHLTACVNKLIIWILVTLPCFFLSTTIWLRHPQSIQPLPWER